MRRKTIKKGTLIKTKGGRGRLGGYKVKGFGNFVFGTRSRAKRASKLITQ